MLQARILKLYVGRTSQQLMRTHGISTNSSSIINCKNRYAKKNSKGNSNILKYTANSI
jgi:hypothetical protein